MKILKIVSSILIAGICLWIVGCSSGLKAFQRGDYFLACENAVSRLRSKPDNEKARVALSRAYPLALENALREINNIANTKSIRNYERIITLYNRMNKLADEINRCPAALTLIPYPREFYNERQQAVNTATQLLYDEGEKALSFGTLESARLALDYFIRANRYSSGYRDVQYKIEQARYEATLRVIVVRPLLPRNYQINANFFYDRLMSEITRNTYRHLVRFYTPEEAIAERMNNPHQLLELNFENFVVGNSRETSKTVDMKRDSVELRISRDGQKIYGTVRARYITHRVEIISSGTLRVRTIDPVNRRTFNNKSFSGRHVWSTEWASFTGDERALNNSQKAMVGRRRQLPPPPQDLFADFANPLYAKATEYINAIY